MSNDRDYYAILGVSPDADEATIEEAYDRLAKEIQPDVDAEPSDPERMRDLDEAFDVLDDPAKRSEYDRTRGTTGDGSPVPAWAAGAAPGAGAQAATEDGELTVEDAEADLLTSTAPGREGRDPRLIAGIALIVAGLGSIIFGVVVLAIALSDDGSDDIEGFTTTDSGMQYQDTEVGEGPTPEEGQITTLHFTGYLSDGSPFASSEGQTPLAFALGEAPIEGLDEGVATMQVGGERTVILPPELAFGEQGRQGVPPNETIRLDLDLLAISDPPPASPPEVTGEEMDLGQGLTAIDIVVGEGDEAETGQTVAVHYASWLASDGTLFDSSLGTGERPPDVFSFTIGGGNVIQGWDLGVPGMREGGKRRLLIPAALAYGSEAQGETIPANSDLIFDIELIDVSEAIQASPAP
jgi:peptidylprolyl isomerase